MEILKTLVQSLRTSAAPGNVLSAIFSAGELRIIDVANKLNIPPISMNALMQYLKRRGLVNKKGLKLQTPYSLTSEGLAALREMEHREAEPSPGMPRPQRASPMSDIRASSSIAVAKFGGGN